MKYLLLLFLLLNLSCKTEDKSKNNYQSNQKTLTEDQAYKAKELMTNLCYTCHNPETAHEQRIAPPMLAIKMHYLRKHDSKEDFVKAIKNFTQKPSEDKVLLKGAVKKYGLMPYQPYKEDDIQAIATYMYDYELEKPEWFDAHMKEKGRKHFKQKGKKLGKQQRKGPKQKGMEIALATKKQLGKNLMKAINEKGPVHAVDFCNVQAMPITTKMENKYDAVIKRASDKPRNPKNKATAKEEGYIKIYKEQLSNGEKTEPILDKTKDGFDFYYPIVTNDMCLKCHGDVGSDVQPETYKTISLKYPDDMAVGYNVNEVRGMWHIQFQKGKR